MVSSPERAEAKALKELDLYLETNFEDEVAEASFDNPLEFWSNCKKAGQFENLAEVALQILSIPCTSAAVERLFSLGGNVMTLRRMRLSAKHVGDTCKLKKRKRGRHGKHNFEDVYKKVKKQK